MRYNMASQEPVREISKIPSQGLRLHLDGDILVLSSDAKTYQEEKRIDLRKFDLYLRGIDTDGFTIVETLPVGTPVEEAEQDSWKRMHESADFKHTTFNPRRRRLHGNVQLPPNYVLYHEEKTKLGGMHKIFVGPRKDFLIRVETFRGGARLHNLGSLSDTKSWIARFLAMFQKEHDWMTKSQIKDKTYADRMFDSQKLAMGLVILEKEGLIKKRGDSYASVDLKVDTLPTIEEVASSLKRKRQSTETSEKSNE